MDLCFRKMVEWDLQLEIKEARGLGTLQAAVVARRPPSALIHHRGRGEQFAGHEYRQVLARAQMLQSIIDCPRTQRKSP